MEEAEGPLAAQSIRARRRRWALVLSESFAGKETAAVWLPCLAFGRVPGGRRCTLAEIIATAAEEQDEDDNNPPAAVATEAGAVVAAATTIVITAVHAYSPPCSTSSVAFQLAMLHTMPAEEIGLQGRLLEEPV